VVVVVAALMAGGSGAAWGWWQVVAGLPAVTASTVTVPPATGTVRCTAQATNDVWGLYNNRVDLDQWLAPSAPTPAGSTRRYLVQLAGSDGTVREKYTANAVFTASFTNTELAPAATTTYTVRVMAVADFGATSWTSTPIGAVTVTATRRTFLWTTYYELACGVVTP
jgi:hypothetical protein